MHTRVVTFYGGKFGSDGLPERFHRYFIVASPAPMIGATATVASVVALTSASEPSVPHVVIQNGSEADAIDNAVAALERLPGNMGLQRDS